MPYDFVFVVKITCMLNVEKGVYVHAKVFRYYPILDDGLFNQV